MNQKMKTCEKMVIAALFAVMVAVAGPMKAFAVEAQNASPQPLNRSGIVEMLEYQGMKVHRVTASTTAKLIVAGAGFLDAICPSGGVLGTYAMAFDEAAPGPVNPEAGFANAISPSVYTTNDTTSAQHGMQGCWIPPHPIKFINGLYGQNSGSGLKALFYTHCSDGSNPCLQPL